MAPIPKHQRQRKTPSKAAVAAVEGAPLVPIEEVQGEAAKQRAMHPTLDDDTVALVVLHLTTRQSMRQISRSLNRHWSWAYGRMHRPEVQSFMQDVARVTLGAAATRAISTMQDLADKADDPHLRYKAADALLNRAGLGNDSSHGAAGNQAFAFSFAAPKGTT